MVKTIGWLNAIMGMIVLGVLSGITGWHLDNSDGVSGTRVFMFILAMFLLLSGMALVSSVAVFRSKEHY